jgi:hypothetical protein
MEESLMDSYDLHTPDNYALHLAEQTTGAVIAIRDIHNQEGMLLVKKGFVIKADTMKRLLSHKLIRPLETSVSLENALNGDRLFDDILSVLRADKESQVIHQAFEMDDLLRDHCYMYEQYPLIAQKLTVLSTRLKGEYTRALYCGWFSMALAMAMNWDEAAVRDAFLAGLVHDTGLLHIDPAIVEKEGAYTPEEWRAMQSHSLITEMFLSYVDDLSDDVRRAVREHHERCDGTGYPAALFGDKLGSLGQIVAMADTVWGISKNPSGRKVHSLTEVLTIVKMNTAQYPAEVYSALYRLHRGAGLSAGHRPPPGADEVEAQYLVRMERQLRVRFQLANRLRGLLSPDHDRLVRSAHFKLERLWFVVNGSGLLSESMADWLKTVRHKGEEAAANDIHEMRLMYGELQWQLAQLARALQLVLNRSSGLGITAREAIEGVVETLNKPIFEHEGPSGTQSLMARDKSA